MINFSEHALIKKYTFLKKPHVLVDVGAHQGTVSLSFAKLSWKVISFEPENGNYNVLKEKLASFHDVYLFDKAVSDSNAQKLPFYISKKHYGIHSLKPFHETHKIAYEVETITLNTALESLQISEISLLKVDIEGADFLALKGLDIEKYKPELVMVEFMDNRSQKNFGYTHHDMAIYMEKLGYLSFISEWAPIKEYGIEGVIGEPHIWLQCKEYPLDHEPAWGNMIFVPKKRKDDFLRTYKDYLDIIKGRKNTFAKSVVRKIPGAKWLYNSLMNR